MTAMLSSRLKYHVCYSSSEDTEHPAKEMDQQGPDSKGWRSKPFCIFPQEIAFQLASRAHIDNFQLLMHHRFIPESIDFLIGDVEKGKEETYANAKFTKLGSVQFSDNQESGLNAREFKTIAADCEGLFVKLIVHKNHMSKINRFNQVSVMGVNFLGKELEANNNKVHLPPANGAPETTNGMDAAYEDLAFNMYMDNECVKHMRQLEARKMSAVRADRFNYAKNCKDNIELLRRAGLILGKLQIEKRQAIEDEQYDKAKLKNDHIEEYRAAVMESLRTQQLLEEDGMDPNNDQQMDLELPPPPGKKKRPPTPPPEPPEPPRPKSDPLPPIPTSPETRQTSSSSKKPMTPPPPIYSAPVRARTPSPAPPPPPPASAPPPQQQTPPATTLTPARHNPRSKYQWYDDRTLPALRNRKLIEGVLVNDVGTSNQISSILTENDRRIAALPIEVFGEKLVENFYAKTFIQKEEGLRALQDRLKNDEGSIKADKVTRAGTFLILKSLKDKVYTVFHLAVETLQYLVGPFASNHRTSNKELGHTIETVLPELVMKTGENSTRVQSTSVDTIVRLADIAETKDITSSLAGLTTPLHGVLQPRAAQAKIETVERIVSQYGVEGGSEDGAMSAGTIANLAVSAIEHPNDSIRAAGTDLLLLIYPDHRKLVRKKLPDDNKKTRKNITYRSLFEELDMLDGDGRQSNRPATLGPDSPAFPRTPDSPDTSRHRPSTEQNAKVKKAVRSQSIPNGHGSKKDDDDDRTCVFCGDMNDKYATEEGIEYHMWKQCPMLLRCSNCKQVVPVSNYTEHLLNECRDHQDYRACDRCQEAIHKNQLERHTRAHTCLPAKSGTSGNHCPLCHQNIPPFDAGWKQHLMHECRRNPRNGLTPAATPRSRFNSEAKPALRRSNSFSGGGLRAGPPANAALRRHSTDVPTRRNSKLPSRGNGTNQRSNGRGPSPNPRVKTNATWSNSDPGARNKSQKASTGGKKQHGGTKRADNGASHRYPPASRANGHVNGTSRGGSQLGDKHGARGRAAADRSNAAADKKGQAKNNKPGGNVRRSSVSRIPRRGKK